ncbi:hypothetical protein GCM10027447_04730 [Glycomyces halotolerans]
MPATPASRPDQDPPTPPEPPRPPAPPEPPETVKITDPEVLRALAHPARLSVWDFLGTCRLQGKDGATATEIAGVVGMTPSAMSYHLRTLAKAGFIEEAPSRGDARERVWRIALHSFNLGADNEDPESTRLAESAATQAIAAQLDRHFARWQEIKYQAAPAVREASMFTQSRLRVTVEEAAEIQRKIHEVLEPYQERTFERAKAEEPPADADGTMLWNFSGRLFPHV